jgi:thiamine pyrophosphate-dependent acetolactate synthase large subunit-like protein
VLTNYLGTAWYSNSSHLGQACAQADLIVSLGEDFTAFSIRGFKPQVGDKLIQIHPYMEELGRSFSLKKGYCGNAAQFIQTISTIKKPWGKLPEKQPVESVTNKYLKVLGASLSGPLTYFADVGNAGYAAITDLSLTKGQGFYTPGKNGVCGYSIPAAIGYAYGKAADPVITIVGDLAFLMNMQEIANVKKFKTKNSFLVFNNKTPQNILVDQIKELSEEIQCDMPEMHFEGIANFAGLQYKHIHSPEEFGEWLTQIDLSAENYIVELDVPKDDQPLKGD